MLYNIGMDGGGTKTRCVVTLNDNSVHFKTTGRGTNFLVQGIDTTCENILNIIDECCNALKISYSDIDKILLGTAGAGRKADAEKLENAFYNYCKRKQIEIKNFMVESDAEIALEGALSGKPGCVLIAGTGSIIYGKDGEGNIFRSGGFGKIIGDEGSGYSIGRKALQVLSKYYDGRSKFTALISLIKTNHNISSPDELIREVYENNFNIASIAPSVIQAADNGDDAALKIIDEESDELILLVSSMLEKMNTQKTRLCLLGSLIENANFYSRLLKEKISQRLKGIELHTPEHPPEMGAVFLAQKQKITL